MQVEIKIKKEVNIKTLQVMANVRYWNDSSINDVEDTQDGQNIPCKDGDNWCPRIEIETGKITNWETGKKAVIHYKVVDGCAWSLLDENGESVLMVEDGYVPDTLCPVGDGYGDYIIMNIDENGVIEDWNFNFEDFQSDED